jgi:hypothetical protein
MATDNNGNGNGKERQSVEISFPGKGLFNGCECLQTPSLAGEHAFKVRRK